MTSSSSILSDEFLKSRNLKPIRESKVVSKDKRIVLWTDVVIEKNFPNVVSKIKFKYNTSQKINDGSVPDVVNQLQYGIVLSVPLEFINQHLD